MKERLLKASDYGDRENQAVLQVLVELAQILGSQHKNFALEIMKEELMIW